jgi:hypothetical protein
MPIYRLASQASGVGKFAASSRSHWRSAQTFGSSEYEGGQTNQ